MVENNKTCILCGTKYTYCNNCAEFDHLPYWMICYCSRNCKDIFDTLSAYNMKQITKDKARDILSKCDLSNKHSFKESTLNCINSIMEETVTKKSVVKEIKHQATEKVEEVIDPIVETPVIDTDDIKSLRNESFINHPVMGDTAVKQPKRMKYTKKK